MLTRVLTGVALLLLTQAPPGGVTQVELEGARNVTRVDATIMCAGATSPAAFAEIRKQGFASIINLRREQEPGADIPGARAAAEQAGLKYVHIPFDGARPDPASAEAFISAVTEPSNQPAFVHCGTANRVAALWLIKRVVVDGWEVDRAQAEAKLIGLTSADLERFALDYAATHRR
jgi:uncharacterized protein (TIGR01244 family)